MLESSSVEVEEVLVVVVRDLEELSLSLEEDMSV